MTTLILTDNKVMRLVADELAGHYGDCVVRQSPAGSLDDLERLDVRENVERIIASFDLVISIHCKQFFPRALVSGVRCINVHPGLNPHNRGWFPQVFAIVNGLPLGVTIHEMDDELDHGPIIAQREYAVRAWDTSGSAYAELLRIEGEMLRELFPVLRSGSYRLTLPASEGNVNYRRDFDALCALELDKRATIGDVLKILRATSHEGHRNAYFVDNDGRRVYVRILLEPDAS